MKNENTQPEKKFQTLSKEQAQRLLEVARGHPYGTLVTIALITGMRQGELVALHWRDINFDEHVLQIKQSAKRVVPQGVILSELKTPSSRRTIFLSPLLIEVLNRQRANQEVMRQMADNTWREQDLVFCNQWGGYLTLDSIRMGLRSIVRKANLPHLHFHDLRSSTTALLLALDVHPQIVQAMLGHSAMPRFSHLHLSSHVFQSLQQEAMHKLSDLFAVGNE